MQSSSDDSSGSSDSSSTDQLVALKKALHKALIEKLAGSNVSFTSIHMAVAAGESQSFKKQLAVCMYVSRH